MTSPVARLFILAATLSTAALASLPAQAQDVRREDMVTFSPGGAHPANPHAPALGQGAPEARAQAAQAPHPAMPGVPGRDPMTREQYKANAHRFNLDIGA